MAFISYLDSQISRQALAGLMDLATTAHGARALGETFLDFFILSLKSLADEISLIATSGWPEMPGIVTDLVDMNWGPDEPAPQIVCTDLGTNYELTEDVVSKLVQFGAIDPDPGLDNFLRKRWGIPERDPDAPSAEPPPGPPDGPKPIPGRRGRPRSRPGAEETGSPSRSRRETPSSASAGARDVTPEADPRRGRGRVRPAAIRQEHADALTAVMAAVKTQALDPLRDQISRAGRRRGARRAARGRGDAHPGHRACSPVSSSDAMARDGADSGEPDARRSGHPGRVDPRRHRRRRPRLEQVAAARAGMLGAYLTQQAASRALQVAAAEHPQVSIARKIEHTAGSLLDFLTGLSDASLTDQLGAALSAATNSGRSAAMAAAPGDAGPVQYAASEILDDNCCDPCRDEDGTVFDSLADADAAYPVGAYINCAGGARCRGVVVALWGGE